MAKCRECRIGKLTILGTGGFGDTVEVECDNCGEIYEVEPDGLGGGGEEWVEAKMKDSEVESLTPELIRRANDFLRQNLCSVYFKERGITIKGKLLITAIVASLPDTEVAHLLQLTQSFDNFNENNDPHHEHDFGSVEAFGSTWFWKFDYYDETCEYFGHANHVLTLMASEEY